MVSNYSHNIGRCLQHMGMLYISACSGAVYRKRGAIVNNLKCGPFGFGTFEMGGSVSHGISEYACIYWKRLWQSMSVIH
jgi:hypothetical protein